jgi:DNA-binding winged helix-turn-helix (wHTH) protein
VQYNTYFFKINNQEVSLTKSEHTVIECIFDQKGLVTTRDMLLRSLYGENGPRKGAKILDVMMHRIKKKITTISPEVGEHIATIWGRGYAIADSKTVDSTRWVIGRKAEILENLANGSTTRQDVMAETPLISEEELDEWLMSDKLRVTQGVRVKRKSQ